MVQRHIARKEQVNFFAELALLLYISECTFGCSGRWLSFGPLSIRMVLFILCIFATFPPLVHRLKTVMTHPQVVVTVLFGADLLLCVMLGLKQGNVTGFIWADLSGFLALALVPGFFVVMGNRGAIERAIKVIFFSALALGIITVGLHFWLAFAQGKAINQVNDWINEYSLGGLALLNSGSHRIYFRSQIFLQVALLYGVWAYNKATRRVRICLLMAEGILLFALILSYTRGFWLGFAASAVLVLILEITNWKRLLTVAGGALAVVAILVGLSTLCYHRPVVLREIVDRFDPNLLVSSVTPNQEATLPSAEATVPTTETVEAPEKTQTDIANEAAVNIRGETLAALKEKIKRSPIIGSGLGTNLDGIRNDGKTEYMYLDILMKTGFVGLLLFMAVYFGFIPVWICRKSKAQKQNRNSIAARNHFLLAAYLGVALVSFFNPFLDNPMGTMLLMLTSTALWTEDSAKESESHS